MRVWVCPCLTVWLTACASSEPPAPDVVPALPPDSYLEACPVSLRDGSIGGALVGLRSAIECARADKAALRAWRDEHAADDSEADSDT